MKTKLTIVGLALFFVSMSFSQKYHVGKVKGNTEFQDFGLSYYKNDKVVFASSRGTKEGGEVWSGNNQPFLDFYIADIKDKVHLSNINYFSKELNSFYHEANAVFTKDFKKVYFTRNTFLKEEGSETPRKKITNQLYSASLDDNGNWGEIESLPFNKEGYQMGHPALNNTEDKLYFISDIPSSLGGTDIYEVSIASDGTYGEPINLGPVINTSKNEMFPFIDDNNVLYFSSTGFLDSKGGLDLYATKKNDKGIYVKPINLGETINSEQDDFCLVKAKGKNFGFFSSNREGGEGDDDIYSFKELDDLFPVEKKSTLVIEVKDMDSGDLLSDANIVFYKDSLVVDGDIVFYKDSLVVDGDLNGKKKVFQLEESSSSLYKIDIAREGYVEEKLSLNDSGLLNLTIYLKKLTDASSNVNVLGMEGVDLGVVEELTKNHFGELILKTTDTRFELNSSYLNKSLKVQLDEVVKFMKEYSNVRIECGTHTDTTAPEIYNDWLSLRRAKRIVNYLVNKGIDRERLIYKSYGERAPINRCVNGVRCSEEEHAENRRVEFKLLNQGSPD